MYVINAISCKTELIPIHRLTHICNLIHDLQFTAFLISSYVPFWYIPFSLWGVLKGGDYLLYNYLDSIYIIII